MPKYGKKAQEKVGRALHEMKIGKLISGNSKKKVKSRKQAIAIGLSEARKEGAKVPKQKKAAAAKKKKASLKKKTAATKKKKASTSKKIKAKRVSVKRKKAASQKRKVA